MTIAQTDWAVPEGVSKDLVVDWDIYTEEKLKEDIHLGWQSLHATAPDIFWTPRNGGHWVITRFDDQVQVLTDAEHFSSKELHIPPMFNDHVMIPLNLDPPEHTRYRAVLMRYLGVGAIKALEPKLYEWANRLIDGVIDKGSCDFTEELGAGFPVSVFMELMGMPLERFAEFRGIANKFFRNISVEERGAVQDQIATIIRELLEEKRRNPGQDLTTALINEQVRGQPLTQAELESMGLLLFLGGLDTVANALTFAFRFLATHPEMQDRLAADPSRLPDFVEESLRRFAVVNQTRIVKKETVIKGAHFRPGQMLICPLTAAGLDERRNPDPQTFDLDRANRGHITFSIGAHTCIGNMLGRLEMRVFTDVWLKRVGHFRLAPQGKPLEWDVPVKAQVS